MMIAFPPCTHLAVSGARWFAGNGTGTGRSIDVHCRSAQCVRFPHKAIENPNRGNLYTDATQAIPNHSPWQYGHGETQSDLSLAGRDPAASNPLPRSWPSRESTANTQDGTGPRQMARNGATHLSRDRRSDGPAMGVAMRKPTGQCLVLWCAECQRQCCKNHVNCVLAHKPRLL